MVLEFPDLMSIQPYDLIHFRRDFLLSVELAALVLDDFSDDLAVDDVDQLHHHHRLLYCCCCHVMISIVMIVVNMHSALNQHPISKTQKKKIENIKFS